MYDRFLCIVYYTSYMIHNRVAAWRLWVIFVFVLLFLCEERIRSIIHTFVVQGSHRRVFRSQRKYTHRQEKDTQYVTTKTLWQNRRHVNEKSTQRKNDEKHARQETNKQNKQTRQEEKADDVLFCSSMRSVWCFVVKTAKKNKTKQKRRIGLGFCSKVSVDPRVSWWDCLVRDGFSLLDMFIWWRWKQKGRREIKR